MGGVQMSTLLDEVQNEKVETFFNLIKF
jgi:hypothetical protein